MPPRPTQLDLLDWTPPVSVARFEDRKVRAVSLYARLCRAMAASLHDAALKGKKRPAIAACMSAYLGEAVSVNMLDAYVSEARTDHTISLPRFVALIHATGDQRLLQLLAELFGWAVVPGSMVHLIEAAAIREQEDVLKRRRQELVSRAKREGAL